MKNKVLIPAFGLIFLLIILSINVFAAQDFIIENRTASLFVVNGTTGNIVMAPSFGLVGIGTLGLGLLVKIRLCWKNEKIN